MVLLVASLSFYCFHHHCNILPPPPPKNKRKEKKMLEVFIVGTYNGQLTSE